MWHYWCWSAGVSGVLQSDYICRFSINTVVEWGIRYDMVFFCVTHTHLHTHIHSHRSLILSHTPSPFSLTDIFHSLSLVPRESWWMLWGNHQWTGQGVLTELNYQSIRLSLLISGVRTPEPSVWFCTVSWIEFYLLSPQWAKDFRDGHRQNSKEEMHMGSPFFLFLFGVSSSLNTTSYWIFPFFKVHLH